MPRAEALQVPLPEDLCKFIPISESFHNTYDPDHPVRLAPFPWQQIDLLWGLMKAEHAVNYELEETMHLLRVGRWPDMFVGSLRVRFPAEEEDDPPTGTTAPMEPVPRPAPSPTTAHIAPTGVDALPLVTGSSTPLLHDTPCPMFQPDTTTCCSSSGAGGDGGYPQQRVTTTAAGATAQGHMSNSSTTTTEELKDGVTSSAAQGLFHSSSGSTKQSSAPYAVLTQTFTCLNLNIARQILASQALLLLAPDYAQENEKAKSKLNRSIFSNCLNTRDNVFELNGQTLMEQAMELLSAAQTTRPAAEVRRYVSPDADWTKYAGQDKTLTPEFEALMAAKRAFAADLSLTPFRWTLRNVSADQLSGPRSTLSVKEESETMTHFCFAFELYCVGAGCAGVRDDADPLSMPEAFSTAMSEYVGEPLTRVIYRCLMAASKQLRCAGLMADLWREFSLTLCPPFLSSVHDYICFYFDAFFKQRRRDAFVAVESVNPLQVSELSAKRKKKAVPEDVEAAVSGCFEIRPPCMWHCTLKLYLRLCGYYEPVSLSGDQVVSLLSDEGLKKLKTASRVMTRCGAECFSFLFRILVQHLLTYNTKDEKMYNSPSKAMDGFNAVLPRHPLRRWCLEDIDSDDPGSYHFPLLHHHRAGSPWNGAPPVLDDEDGGSSALEGEGGGASRGSAVEASMGLLQLSGLAGVLPTTERSVVHTLYRRALLQRQARPGGYLSPTSRVMALLLERLCRPFYECAVLCREYAVVDPQRTAERALLESYLQQCRNQRALSGLSRPPGATQRDRFESAIYVARGDGFAPGGAPRRSQGDSIARESDAARTKRVAEAAVFSFVGHGATFEESFQRAAAKALVVVTSYRQMRMEQDFIIAADELDSSVPPPVPRAPQDFDWTEDFVAGVSHTVAPVPPPPQPDAATLSRCAAVSIWRGSRSSFLVAWLFRYVFGI
eukprot:gene8031-5586_t